MKSGDINKAAIKATLESLFGSENVMTEYRFHPVRLWRFDYAVPSIRLAVEYHGHSGFVGKGASGHSTIKGLTSDCQKINSAIIYGWKVLAFTALHFRESERQRHKLTDIETTIKAASTLTESI